MNMDSPSPMLQARAAPAATPLLPVAYRVFISHGAVDRAPVNRIVGACRDAGVEPYIYEHDQRPGQSVAEKVQQQIRSSDAVIVLLSKQSATSAYVQQEIGYALAQRKPVLPLVEQGIGEETLDAQGC